MATHPKRPRDPNQLAKLIVELSTGEEVDVDPNAGKDPAAIKRGSLGGVKGGSARAKALTPSQRSEIARMAAAAHWKKR